MNKLNIGIVGCGFITREVHLPALKKIKNINVNAVCDIDLDTAKKVAKKFNVPKIYSDYSTMLKSEKFDVIHVCTSIYQHAPMVIDALNAGCHVLVEKPMASTIEEADKELVVAEATGKKICVIHQLLYHPVILRLSKIINRGDLGDITHIEIKQGCPPWDYPTVADPNHWWHKLNGGIYGDTLPHPLYLARHFLGEIEPITIYGNKLGKYAHLPVDDLEVVLKGRKGIGFIFSSSNIPSLWEIDVFGTKKIAHGDLNNSYLIVYNCKTNNGRGIMTSYIKGNISRSMQILLSSINTGIKMLSHEHRGHFVQIHLFYEKLNKGEPLPVTGEDDREIIRLQELIISQMKESWIKR